MAATCGAAWIGGATAIRRERSAEAPARCQRALIHGRTTLAAHQARRAKFCPEWWGLTTWLDAVLQHAPITPYLINLGASDRGANWATRTPTPSVYEWTTRRSVASRPIRATSASTAPQIRTSSRRTAVTPSNIVSLLDAARAPADPHLLKVDIDSYDADVVRAVLSTRRPTFIFVELNEKIPPPLSLCFHYRAWSPWPFGTAAATTTAARSRRIRSSCAASATRWSRSSSTTRSTCGPSARRPPASIGFGRQLQRAPAAVCPRATCRRTSEGTRSCHSARSSSRGIPRSTRGSTSRRPLPARHAAIANFFWLDTLLGFAELKPLPASRRTPLPRDYVKWLEGK